MSAPCFIPLTRGLSATVDRDLFEDLSRFNWLAHEHQPGKFYAARRTRSAYLYMHRVIAGAGDSVIVDHINGEKLDNRRANLRFCTRPQNQWNSGPRTGRFKGVHWAKRDRRWVAQIAANGRRINLGSFLDEVEAARAYDAAARDLHGEFAHQNLSEATR